MLNINNKSDLSSWLQYIGKVHPSSIELGLDRIVKVAVELNLYPFTSFVITVGGTNGKGTTVSLLESILTKSLVKSGYKIGAYLSPHLIRFNERIRINSEELSDKEICCALQRIDQARGKISLTYFEFITLAALYIFKERNVDIAILEVGLGGRLDAINIIDSDIAVITNVGLEHCDWLGHDRETIAKEKAGIIRKSKPLVYGESDIPKAIIKQVKALNIPFYRAGQEFSIRVEKERLIWKGSNQKEKQWPLPHTYLDDTAIALQVVSILPRQFKIRKEAIDITLKTLQIPGRFQLMSQPVSQILDVAHNPHAVSVLAQRLEKQPCSGKTYALFSMLKGKDIENSIKSIEPLIHHWGIAELEVERALSLRDLISAFKKIGIENYSPYHSVCEGYNDIVNKMHVQDRLLIFGSFYIVSATLALPNYNPL